MQTTKYVNEPSPEKLEVTKKIETLAKKWEVLVATNLTKVRTAQIMALRKNFRGKIEIYVAKNRLTTRALRNTDLKDIETFIIEMKGQKALMFTDIDPFKLNMIFEKNKINLPARSGDIATNDIVIPAGNTGLPAGPVLSDFREAGVLTKIETGSVSITKDTVVAKKGDIVSAKLSGLISKLGIKPIQAGISISSVYWNGLILNGEDVRIDLGEYQENLRQAFQQALSLSVNASYPTVEGLPSIITKANLEAQALSIHSGYVVKDTLKLILSKAYAEALTINKTIEEKST